MGFLSRSTKAPDDLLTTGTRGKGTVITANMSMAVSYEGRMSSKHQEALLAGDQSMTRYKIELQVEVPGQNPYNARITVPVPMMKVPYMTGGSVLPVLVDPNKPDRIAIDWNGEFQRGTIQQMANANPMIAAALRGANVDIDAITRMQEAQIAAGQQPGNIVMGGQLMGAPAPAAPATNEIWGPAITPAPAAAAAPSDDDRIEKLEKLARLRDSGALTDTEFETEKARILSE